MGMSLDHVGATQYAEGIRQVAFGDLRYPNENYLLAFRQYLAAVDFAFYAGCRKILELGSGVSTVLFARLARETGARIYSLDTTLTRLHEATAGTSHAEEVARHVQHVDGTSITADELREYYGDEEHEAVGGVPASALADALDFFVCRAVPRMWWEHLEGQLTSAGWSARRLLRAGMTLTINRELLDAYSVKRDFANEIAFLEEQANAGRANVLDRLTHGEGPWDMVFFDSGELASLVEWEKLRTHIAPGGFAVFHDIFFPKSFKNFIVCASLVADPAWRVVHVDNSTKQGLLVAQRLRG